MITTRLMILVALVGCGPTCLSGILPAGGEDDLRSVPLQSRIDAVQPMTGIVLWTSHPEVDTDTIQLEYSYLTYDDVAVAEGRFDWSVVDQLLDQVAARGHQAILRFYFTYPGRATTVPDFIRQHDDYRGVRGTSEGKPTGFPDWSNPALQRFTLDFYSAFARRYDRDRRLAFLQTGFGLWAEYHIYDGPKELGNTFPDREFQTRFLRHLNSSFSSLPWMISIDAADAEYSPFQSVRPLREMNFGLFDDSFLCKQHAKVNARNWQFFGDEQWHRGPRGGEFSYYTGRDQRRALQPRGPHGVSFEDMAKRFHITFMIGNDQPKYQPLSRIREASLATGYRFRVTDYRLGLSRAVIDVINEGIAPIYRDAYVTVGGTRSEESLKGLLPGGTLRCHFTNIESNSTDVTIESDHLVAGQTIQFEADLP